MTAIIIISIACAVALVGLIAVLRLFDGIQFGEEPNERRSRHNNQTFILAALAVVCILIACMAIKQDGHVNEDRESKRQTELQQRQLQHEIDGIKERTAALIKGSTWVVSPKGLIEYEERVSR